MSKITIEVWGRVLDVEVVYDVYQDEEVIKEQIDTYERFIAVSSRLFAIAENKAKEYCLRLNREDIGTDNIVNIFKYVRPKAIYIKRNTTKDRVVAILCAYKFNPDDGIAIVFKNETFVEIGTENIVL